MAQRQYVSGAVSALNGDGIVVHVINDSDAVENTHVTIYLNTGGGATVAEDTGNTAVAATWTCGATASRNNRVFPVTSTAISSFGRSFLINRGRSSNFQSVK